MSQPGTSPFGVTSTGQAVQKVTIAAGDLTATFLTWGAVLQSVRLKGVTHDLTLGSDLLADYEGAMRHHGSLVGPVANRFSGAKAVLKGRNLAFEPNQDGRITLHSGSVGTHLKVWHLAEATDSSVTFTLDLPDGEGGFPGNRQVTARFSLHSPATLQMEVTVTTDAATFVNFVNHSYWNLDGTANWSGHTLQVHADRYLPTDEDFVPTGAIVPVAGTAMDFRSPRPIQSDANPFDNNFCLSDARRPLADALVLTGTSGLSMTIATTEPGIQVYDGRNAVRPGRAAYEGLAIEAQFWPDAPNKQGFPSIEVMPEETYRQIKEWRFAKG